MRACLLVVLVACTRAAQPAAVTSPATGRAPDVAPLAEVKLTGSCVEAATGLEGATRSVRAPESSVLDAMKQRCDEDGWSASARMCFTTMKEDDLGQCVKLLDDRQRSAFLEALGATPRIRIAIARARLGGMQVGVAECDEFIAAVNAALSCEQLPLDARADLGSETADFWSLPTSGLSPQAMQRMATACGESRASLAQHVSSAGCL